MPEPAKENTRNPFTAKRIAPGTIAYIFPDETTVDTLIDRLAARHWHGQIVGPHGSGKSTLLRTLATQLQQRGHHCQLLSLAPGERKLPPFSWPSGKEKKKPLLLVDGYEQLGLRSRWKLRRAIWTDHIGLLATTHRRVWLPLIYETRVSLNLAQQVVQRLAESTTEKPIILPAEVSNAFAEAKGDLREMLFCLYDVFERKRTGAASP